MSIIMVISSACFPVVGYYVDQYGQRIRLLVAASVMTMTAHLLFLEVYPMLPLIVLGLGYGVFGAVIWPTVVFLVPKDRLVDISSLIATSNSYTNRDLLMD